VANTPERRAEDRRSTVDLNRPAYQERRNTGSGRRPVDQRLAADIEALPKADLPEPEFAAPIDPTKSVAELQADFDSLEAVLHHRLHGLQGLSDEEFQAAQVRDEAALIASAAQLKRLRAEIELRSTAG
jgi:hypothetical protein